MKLVTNKCCASITPRTFQTKPKKRITASQLKCNGDGNICILTKTTSPVVGKRLWEMRHERAVYISAFHHSSWKVYPPLDFVNYLIIQPIWLGVFSAQYEKIAHKVSINEKIYDIMDTGHDCSYKRVTNWKHQNPNSTNPRSTNYDLRHHLKPNCKETYRHWIFESDLICSTERLRTFSGNPRNVLWNWYKTNTYPFLEARDSSGTKLMLWLLIPNGYGDCNSEFLMSLSEDNPFRLTHFPLILYQTAIRRYCVQLKQNRQWGLNEENLGTAPDNPSMGDINDITVSTQEKTRSDTEHFRKF